MKQFLVCLAFLCLKTTIISAQGLQIGNKVPDLKITNIQGLPSHRENLHLISEQKDKLIILDFWATWCAPCRAAIPKLDTLHQQFKEKLVILPVTYEAGGTVEPMLRAMKKAHAFNLPQITADKVLNQLFPHRTLPHEVWIYQGKVIAITEYSSVNADNIRLVLNGKTPAFTLKKDLRVNYNKTEPLLVNHNGGEAAALVYHSLLTGYMPGLPAGLDVSAADSASGQQFTVRNAPFVWLARLAYADSNRWFPNARLRLDSKDSLKLNTRLAGIAYHNWLADGNGWCYELRIPARLSGETAYQLIRQDLARLFPAYRIHIEQQTVNSLVLSRTSGKDKIAAGNSKYKVSIGPFRAQLSHAHLNELLMRLERQYLQDSKLPLADGTGYHDAIDLDIDAPLNDLKALNQALARYDLALVEKPYPAELLIISDQSKR